MDEFQKHLPYLMQLLKKYKNTYADYPEGGNMDYWQIPSAGILENMMNQDYLIEQNELGHVMPQLGSGDHRMALENMLMDQDLNSLQYHNQMKPWHGPRYQIAPHRTAPGEGVPTQPNPRMNRLPGLPLMNGNYRM